MAHDVRFSDCELIVSLVDGRTISIPVTWFPTLANATEAQRNNWQLWAVVMAFTGQILMKT